MLTDRSRKALTLCSTLAIATALAAGPAPARAQSFQGSSTVVAGAATVTTAPSTTTVTVDTPSAVINWTPTDTATGTTVPINFQPSGTTAVFQNNIANNDFIVLNRILPNDPNRAVQFNGTIIGQIRSAVAGPVQGGDVYFYSPGGIIVGANAAINVGSLGLSALDLAYSPNGSFDGGTDTFTYLPGGGNGKAVTIQAGASINANTGVTSLVAPVVSNSGTINSLATVLVSADAATIHLDNSGLFDIVVQSGTSGTGTTLANNGTITGPAGNASQRHTVYAVAVPKNTAITMALTAGSSMGFGVASAADVVGNAVVLSGGSDVFGGTISSAPSGGAGTGAVTIDVNNSALTSDARMRATGPIQIGALNGSTSFAANLTAHSDTSVGMFSDGANGNLSVVGDVAIDADRFSSGQGQSAAGGSVTIGASNGGSALVGGSATLNARGFGGSSFTSGTNGGAGTGGMAQIGTFQGGSVTIRGALAIDATGSGGQVSAAGTTGGAGQGGIAQIYHDQAGMITLDGGVNLRADGSGGGVSGAGTGGSGTGGQARAIFYNTVGGASSGGMTVTGNVLATAYGFGGQGGIGRGGTVRLAADTTGQTINVSGDVVLKASGFGGNGAAGFGGTSEIVATGTSDITVNSVNVAAVGAGGFDVGAGAGAGTGGFARLRVSGAGASLTVNNVSSDPDFFDRRILSSEGRGGDTGTAGATAGTGIGGNSTIDVNSGGTLNLPIVTTDTATDFTPTIWSRGFGGLGLADGTTGGSAVGGTANIFVNGGTVNAGPTLLSAVALGGGADVEASGNINGGNASGGSRNVSVTNGGTLSIGLFGGVAGGGGGNALGTGRGGDGTGGTASLTVDNATLNLTSDSIFITQNTGGAGTTGGNAIGGSTFAQVVNGGRVNVDPGVRVLISSNATGGASDNPGGVSGGNATGGNVTLLVDGGTINGGVLEVRAQGEAGGGFVAQGGTGTGGNAVVQLRNANVTAESLVVDASGTGGYVEFGENGNGGSGAGGFAQIIALGGANVLSTTDLLEIDAGGAGGSNFGNSGASGNGTGGTSRLVSTGGATLTLTAPQVHLDSDGQGGSSFSEGTPSADGGDGAAGIAEVFANGGSLVVNGGLFIESDSQGGDGVNGGDGNGDSTSNAVRALLHAQNGSVNVNGLTSVSSQGVGGFGAAGGRGGNATGGSAVILAQSSLAGGSSIALQDVNVYSDAFGGDGGFGTSGATAGAGGAGGSAVGGTSQLFADAGNGVLSVVGTTLATSGGDGGGGGSGGSGDGTPGGAGGSGGAGTGGSVLLGTRSGLDTPANSGSASFTDVLVDASGTGGVGGDGGFGSVSGAGGDGGAAQDGGIVLQSRGAAASITGTATLYADATGGDGGGGASQGRGGDATVGGAGGVGVYVSNRFNRAEAGSLVGGGDLFASIQAIPGRTNDVPAGASYVGDIPVRFQVTNGSVDFGAMSFFVSADTVVGTAPSDVTLTNATVNLSSLDLTTPGDFTLALDNATLNVGSLSIDAGNFVLPATAPTAAGTINVSGPTSLTSGQDILTYANFNTTGDINLFASGSIRVGNFATTGLLSFLALGGSVTTGNLQAGDFLEIDAAQAVATGSVIAGQTLDIDSGGAVTTGALQAGDTVSVTATGAINVGNVTAGIVNPSTDPAAEYTIGLLSQTSVAAGSLNALSSIGVAAPGTIAVGEVSAGGAGIGFLALGGTGVTTGNIVTATNGRTYIANYSMLAPATVNGEFDPALVLALPPVAVNGPVTVNGAISTGTLQINAAQNLTITGATNAANLVSVISGANLTSGAIQAGATLTALATGALTTGNLTAGGNLTAQANGAVLTGALTSGGNLVAGSNQTLATGNVQATGNVNLNAMGAIQTGSILAGQGVFMGSNAGITTLGIDAGDRVAIQAMGSLNLGNITAGIVNPSTATGAVYRIGLSSNGSIVSGNLTARNGVLLGAAQTLTTGAIAGSEALLLAGTGITTGAITAGTLNPSTGARALNGRVLFADVSLSTLGGPFNNFDPNPVFAATPVPTNGPITVNGAIAGGLVRGYATGPISVTGAINAGVSTVWVSNATLSTGAIQSADVINLVGGTGVSTGNLTAGNNPTSKVAVSGGSGGISTGAISTRSDVGLQAGGNVSTGNILGRDVLLLAGGGVSTGSIQALNGTQPSGRVYIGNASMASANANAFSNFATLPLFNAAPVATGGAITLGGSVNAASLRAATAGAFSAQAITAGTVSGGFIDVRAGGTATVGGAWRSRDIELVSGDIDIAAGGSLDALSSDGEVSLASTNGSGAFIGDGLNGSGYALGNDEFSRIKAGSIVIAGSDNPGTATDMTIGTLTINAAQLYGAQGTVVFATGNLATETPGGILRIAGAVTANGFAATNEIELLADTVEIEAANGSLKVNNGSGGLGGLVSIEADHIHVASDAILTKLRADPLYAGHTAELNAPATVQRPDGVLNALGLELYPGQTLYVQNTGTATTPAGFVTTQDGSDVILPEPPPSGGVEVVINGQFVDANGNPVTGRAVFDAISSDPEPDDQQFAGFATSSLINGCAFTTGACTFSTAMDPVAAISSEISLITNATIDDSPTAPAADDADEGDDGSSNEDKDEDSGDEGAAPIAPPTPLISTRPLSGDVNVVEPVAGAGNPALFGSAVNETTAGDDAAKGDAQ